MARKRVSKGALITNKDKKLKKVFEVIGESRNVSEFKEIFKKLYEKDWNRIQKRFQEHEKLSKGKSHPMPNPEKYLENTYNNYIKKMQEGDI